MLPRHTLQTGLTEQHKTAASMFSQPSVNKAGNTGLSCLFSKVKLLIRVNRPIKLRYIWLDGRRYRIPL
jgi:hypothetical protein